MKRILGAGIAILSFFVVGIPSLAGAKDPVPNLPTMDAPQKAVTPAVAPPEKALPETKPAMDQKAAAPIAGSIPGKAPPAPEIKKDLPPTIPAPEEKVIQETVPQPQTGKKVVPGTEPVIVSRLVRNLKEGKEGEEAEVVLKGKNLHRITQATAAGIRVTIVSRTATEMTLKLKGQRLSIKDLTLHPAFGKPFEVPLREEIQKARAEAARTQTALPQAGIGLRPEAVVVVPPSPSGGAGPSTEAEAANQPGEQVGKTGIDKLTSEQKLKELLTSGKEEQYRVYMFDKAGKPDGAWRKSWSGHLLLPDPTKGAKTEVVSLTDSTGRPLTDASGKPLTEWFYQQGDGSLSKLLVDGGGRMAGQLTFAPSGAVLLSLDMDEDQVIDLMNVISPDGREHLVVRDGKGIENIERWRQGIERWCFETAERNAGSAETAGPRQVLSLCGRRRRGNDRSSGSRHPGGEDSRADSWLDKKCKDVLAKGRPHGEGIAEQSRPATHPVEDATAYRAAIEQALREAYNSTGIGQLDQLIENLARAMHGAPPPPPTGDDVVDTVSEVVDDPVHAGSMVRVIRAFFRELTREKPVKEGGGGKEPGGPKTPGSQPIPGDENRSPEEALYNLCQARARNRLLYNLDELENRYVVQKCPDPKIQPKPSGASAAHDQSTHELSSWCRDSEESRKDPSDMAGLIRGGGSGTDCGITEKPGPDGKCQGAGRTVDRGRSGIAGVSLGILYGLPPPVEESPLGDPKPIQ